MNSVSKYLLEDGYNNFSAQAAGIWIGHGLSGLLGGAGGLAGGLKLSENKMQKLVEEASKEGMIKGGIAAIGGLALAKMLKDKYKKKYGHTSYSQALFNEDIVPIAKPLTRKERKEEAKRTKVANSNYKKARFNEALDNDRNGRTRNNTRGQNLLIGLRAALGMTGDLEYKVPEEVTKTKTETKYVPQSKSNKYTNN